MEHLVDIAIYIFLIANGFVAGWFAREKMAQLKVDRYLAQFEKDIQPSAENTLLLDVHVEHGHFYIYNKDDGKFITQVNTKDEMFEYFSKNYPNKNVIMTKDQLALFDTV